ncbi:MAG TPA: hypothetical protein VK486_00230 [Thermoleophilaceae bacterium]|nr:hypothetical protein [Thermoleophilaceae bacterium]
MPKARLMKTPREVVLSKLSRELYVDFLDLAKARGFEFVRFEDLRPGGPALPERYIALRHDVDFAPAYSLEMAELEHGAGVRSTFFVLVDGQFYNPLAGETVEQIRRIHELGHEVGLHFAAGDEVAFRLDVLSNIVGAPVRCFSQHDPVNAGPVTVELPPEHAGYVDASEAAREHDLLYVSDSAMMWRDHTFETALDQDRNLCLLAHPHSWLHPEDDYVALIREFEAREHERVAERFDAFVDALPGYYERRRQEGI